MVTVQNKFNQLNEAVLFLYSIAQDLNYEDLKKDARDSIFGEKLYMKMLDTVIHIQNAIKNKLEVSKEKIDFYFKPINENDLCIDDFVMQYDYASCIDTLTENIQRLREQSQEERLMEYAKLVTEYRSHGNLEEVNLICNLSDFINALSKSNFSDENKMTILKIYCNKEQYEEEIKEIISKTISILEECEEEYQWIQTFCYDYWTNYIKTHDIREMISENSNVEWNYNSNGIVIQPMLAHCSQLSISIPDPDESGKKDVFRIGVLVDENLKHRKKVANIDDIANFMKILGDKSKLDIMDFIKDKAAYGKELADELGLAKGTISHHMSSLASIGIIDTVCEANRIYYKLNQKRLKEIIEELRAYFIQEN